MNREDNHEGHIDIRKKFDEKEDMKLKKLVEQYGIKKWDIIAKYMPGRSSRQCRDRYRNYLVPGFFNGQWTDEEDKLLFEKHNEMGHQWSKMSKFFPRRSANALKNRWNYFVCRFTGDQNIAPARKETIEIDVIGLESNPFATPDFLSDPFENSWNLNEQDFDNDFDFFVI